MKILYAVGNRPSGDNQLNHFLRNTEHSVKIASFLNSSRNIQFVDWMLDPLDERTSKENPALLSRLYEKDILEYDPDLAVIDYEPITLKLVKKLNIPYMLVSPIHSVESVSHSYMWISYQSRLFYYLKYYAYKESIERFALTPFSNSLELLGSKIKHGVQWIRPYIKDLKKSETGHKICAVLNDPARNEILERIIISLDDPVEITDSVTDCSDTVISLGDTDTIAQAILGRKYICVLPSLNDLEQLSNACMVSYLGFGQDLGQLELMNLFAPNALDDALRKKSMTSPTWPVISGKFLHEKVNEYASSI